MVKELIRLMEFRNTHPAFSGEFRMENCGEQELHIVRNNGAERAELIADFTEKKFQISYTENATLKTF